MAKADVSTAVFALIVGVAFALLVATMTMPSLLVLADIVKGKSL